MSKAHCPLTLSGNAANFLESRARPGRLFGPALPTMQFPLARVRRRVPRTSTRSQMLNTFHYEAV